MEQSDRTRWGQVYSPVDIVAYILQKTLVPALAETPVDKIKILEPACGDGRFLTAIYDLVLREYRLRGWPQTSAARNIVSRQLYGLDINARAVKQARDTLHKQAGSIPEHIFCGDTLNKSISYPGLPLEAGYYDVIVGNPPYVTWEIGRETRAYYRKAYRTAANGRINLYRLFIERCIELLKPDGYLGFICPNTYLNDRDSRLLRQLLLKQTHIQEIFCLPESAGIFTRVTQATTILVVQKKQKISKTHKICIKNAPVLDPADQETTYTPQYRWLEKNGGKFQLLPACFERIIEKLNRGRQLGNIAGIFQGEVNLTIHKNDLQDAPCAGNYPLIRGCHIIPYGFLAEEQRNKSSYIQPSRPIRDHAGCKRLVLQQVSNAVQTLRLKCGLLTPQQPVFCANSTNYVLLPDQDISMYYYLMALCHSTVWNLLFCIGSSTNHITVRELSVLPVPDCPAFFRRRFSDLIDEVRGTTDQKQVISLNNELNNIVYRLFALSQYEVELVEKYHKNHIKGLP